jgi:predicted transcriptional regulator
MSPEVLPKDVREFLARFITSVEQLEVLLILFKEEAQYFDAEGLSRRLNSSAHSIAERLTQLAASGLIVNSSEPRGTVYRYAPVNPALNSVVLMLAKTYSERRISVIEQIFRQPSDRIRDLSDAFKFKKEKPDA